MSTITLEAIKSAHEQVAQMIAKYEQQPFRWEEPIMVRAPNLAPGELWVGVIISADGKKKHHIILLPGVKIGINWKNAMDWAKSIGGDLPDRAEGALLFAVMKDEFDPEWYWLNEQHASDSDCAWCQDFSNGVQHYSHKNLMFRARAVRRIYIGD